MEEKLNERELDQIEEPELEEDDFDLDLDEEPSEPDDVNEDLETPELEDEEDDSDDSDVQGNLSKAVKAKNAKIRELKEKLAELEKAKANKSSDPLDDLALDGSFEEVAGPRTRQMEDQIEHYEKWFESQGAIDMEYENPQEFRRHEMAFKKLERNLPKVRRQERQQMESLRENRKRCLTKLMDAYDYDKEVAEYVFNTADFSKSGVTVQAALKEAARKYNAFLDSQIAKRNSKTSAKKRIASGNSRQSGSAASLKGQAKMNKALSILKKDKAYFNDLRQSKSDAELKDYIKKNADRIIKEGF